MTIPYLIGAKQHFLGRSPVQEKMIGDLFREIVSGDPFDYCATIGYCGTIAAYRIGLGPRSEVELPYFTNSEGKPTLAYNSYEFAGTDLNDMIGLMKEQYQELIRDGNFQKAVPLTGPGVIYQCRPGIYQKGPMPCSRQTSVTQLAELVQVEVAFIK